MVRYLPYMLISLFVFACAGSQKREKERIRKVLESTAAWHIERAAAATDSGNYKNAIIRLRRASQLAPWEPVIYNNMGVAFYHMQQYDSSIVAFNTAIRRQPTYAHAFGNLAQTYIAAQNYRHALAAANQAIKLDADYGDAYLLKALALEKSGRRKEAFTFYESAVEKLPNNAGLRINLGSYYYDKGLLNEAIKHYTAALELEPDTPLVHFNLGNCYTRKCLLDRALTEYETAIRFDSTMISALNNYGLVLVEQDEAQAALQVFLRAYQLSPKSVIAFNISIILEKMGKLQQALNYCSDAIEADSTIAVYYMQKGNILHRMKKNQQALAAFQKAIHLEPDMAMGYNNMGNVLIEAEKIQQAQAAYRKAADLYPQNIENLYFSRAQRFAQGINNLLGDCVDDVKLKKQYSFIYNNLGKAYMLIGQDENAIAAFQQAGKTMPDLVSPFENLGFIYQKMGQDKRAKDSFARAFLNRSKNLWQADSIRPALLLAYQALDNKPNFAEALAQLGRIYVRMDSVSAAAGVFQSALTYGSQNPFVLFTYADFMQNHDQRKEAAVYYQKVIELDAEYPQARKRLAQVLMEMGEIEKARKQIAATHYLNGQKLEFAGQWDMALEEYRTAYQLDSLNTDFIVAQGLVFAKKHLDERAKEYFDKALSINPQNAGALYGLGLVYGDQGKHLEAIDVLSRSVAIEPENAESHFALAVNYYFAGNLKMAREHVLKARRLGKDISQAFLSELNSNHINK